MENKQALVEKIASLEETIKRLQATVDGHKHLETAVAAKDQEIAKLSEQLAAKWQRQLEEKEKIIKMLVGHIQAYQQAFRSFLKNTQGGLENAVELEAMLADQINKK